jgi:hypothetical protein
MVLGNSSRSFADMNALIVCVDVLDVVRRMFYMVTWSGSSQFPLECSGSRTGTVTQVQEATAFRDATAVLNHNRPTLMPER